jgi:hypothetical protein
MGQIMNDAENTENDNKSRAAQSARAEGSLVSELKPKGACWYCNAPLDNVRRFCNKVCAQDYQNDEEIFR